MPRKLSWISGLLALAAVLLIIAFRTHGTHQSAGGVRPDSHHVQSPRLSVTAEPSTRSIRNEVGPDIANQQPNSDEEVAAAVKRLLREGRTDDLLALYASLVQRPNTLALRAAIIRGLRDSIADVDTLLKCMLAAAALEEPLDEGGTQISLVAFCLSDRMKSAERISLLRENLLTVTHPRHQQALALALAIGRVPGVATDYAALLKRSTDPVVRMCLIRNIGEFGDPDTAMLMTGEVLAKPLNAEDTRREWGLALEALGTLSERTPSSAARCAQLVMDAARRIDLDHNMFFHIIKVVEMNFPSRINELWDCPATFDANIAASLSAAQERVLLGQPRPGTVVEIVDENGNPAPTGAGE